MKIQRRGPATLDQVSRSIEGMEQQYGMTTKEFENCTDPTVRVPEDDASRWSFLIAQREALNADHLPKEPWTPNYGTCEDRSTRFPAVDREEVERCVAA
jgi:hypothetical protein